MGNNPKFESPHLKITKKIALSYQEPTELLHRRSYCSSALAGAAGRSEKFSVVNGAFFLPGPEETLTIAGLRSRSPSKNPRRNSCITIPSLNS